MKKDNWIIKVLLFTFIITIFVSGLSNYISNNTNITILLIITFIITIIGILFDMIGTSVLTAKESNFHSMASYKVKGSKKGIILIKNRSNIANFCNDVIGDICGIISGSMGAMIAIYLANHFKIDSTISGVFIASILSTITIGGKALGKKYAIKQSDKIILLIGTILTKLSFKKEK